MRTIQIFDNANYEAYWTKFKRDSARGIIFIGDKLLMIQSKKFGEYKFPGGGIESGEKNTDALIREVKEETGYTLISESIAEYGKTLVLRKGSGENEIFEQESFYYTCKVNEREISTPALDEGYESEYEYSPILVFPCVAISANEQLLNISKIPWVMRDLAVLREIKQKKKWVQCQCSCAHLPQDNWLECVHKSGMIQSERTYTVSEKLIPLCDPSGK